MATINKVYSFGTKLLRHCIYRCCPLATPDRKSLITFTTTSIHETHPSPLEHLPIEIFLQIFAFFSLEEILTAFSGLNAHIDSIIRSIRGANHMVSYDDNKGIDLLNLFAIQISRLVATWALTVDFTSLINLRSLTIKYGTLAQLDAIRPQHFPMLEILHIFNVSGGSQENETKSKVDLFQVILSNGFPRLRICTATGIGSLDSSVTWTGSPTLRFLTLDVRTPLAYERIRSICPNLRQFKSPSPSFSLSGDNGRNRRIFAEIKKIKQWEVEKKFILEYCPMFDTDDSLASSCNMIATPSVYSRNMDTIRGRIFPERDPYCLASFLLEIRLPAEYPFKIPEATILDPIYHPNVMENGKHCCCWGYNNETWRPTNPLIDFIKAVIKLIDYPDLEHATNVVCADEYQNNYEKFHERALQCTLNHGRPRV